MYGQSWRNGTFRTRLRNRGTPRAPRTHGRERDHSRFMSDAGCVLHVGESGRSEWRFEAHAVSFDLAVLVASLPDDIGVKRAVVLLQAKAPGVKIDSRDVRQALSQRALATEARSTSALGPMVASSAAMRLHQVEGKGVGGFAARGYARGECILAEEPLLNWTVKAGEAVTHVGLHAALDTLSESDQDAFYALCQNEEHGPTKLPYGIWLSNAFPTDGTNAGRSAVQSSVSRSSAVFRWYCRLNHACSPNVHGAWNPLLGRQTMYALRNIEADEELTVSYLGRTDQRRADRMRELQRGFGFTCTCTKCELRGEALARSDVRMARCDALRGLIKKAVGVQGYQQEVDAVLQVFAAKGGIGLDPKGAGLKALRGLRQKRLDAGLALLEERLALLEEEGEGALSWDTLESAARHCEAMDDKAACAKWARRAAEVARGALGKESEEVQLYVELSMNGKRAGRISPKAP